MDNYSVLTSIYREDRPEFLKQSIDSMLAQTVVTDDYVLVADGPLTEELEQVLEAYCLQYDFFHIVRLEENVGLGAALRAGLNECRNELVARLDADDLSMPERCELQLRTFEENSELAVVGTDMYEFDEDPSVVKSVKHMPAEPEQIYQYGKRRNPFNHSSVMYRKSVIQSVGSYSTKRRSQDLELWSKVVFAGYPCRNLDRPLICFRTDGSNRVRRKKKWANVRSDLEVYKNNYQMGYAGLLDYLFVCTYQIAFFLMPEKLAGSLYRRLFRSKV